MSKYNALWEFIQESKESGLKLTFEQINEIAGIPLDHSFLNYKKELNGRIVEIDMDKHGIYIELIE